MARILIIDDDVQIRELVGSILECGGHEISQAENGKEGMDLLGRQTADLVITDLIMDVQDGFETIIQLRRDYPAVKILAISGGGQSPAANLNRAVELGAHRSLPKPFSVKDLRNVVEELLEAPAP